MSLFSAQSQVTTAQNALNAARAAGAADQAKNKQSLVSATATANQALGTVSTAEDTLNVDQVKQQTSVHTALAAVEEAQTAVNKARATLASTTAQQQASLQTATNQVAQNEAALTSASASAAFATLTDISLPRVSAQVSEADVARVKPGQPASFVVSAYPGRTFTGSVRTIELAGQTTSNVVTYNALLDVDATDLQLLPSMTATVTIVTERDDDAIQVPNVALSGDSDVYVLRNNTPIRVHVQTGITDGQTTRVLDGLQPGDQVVVGGNVK